MPTSTLSGEAERPQVAGAVIEAEDCALDGVNVGVEEIQREVQVVQRQRRGFREVDALRPPGLIARQFG